MFLTDAGVKVETHVTTFSAKNGDDGGIEFEWIALITPYKALRTSKEG